MRRSATIKLTLLPLLASASLARAQAEPDAPPGDGPPGMTPVTAPQLLLLAPGMTPPVMEAMVPEMSGFQPCTMDDPRPECHVYAPLLHMYGGFGHYFGSGGG